MTKPARKHLPAAAAAASPLPAAPKLCVSYQRFSTAAQSDGTSIERQTRLARNWVAAQAAQGRNYVLAPDLTYRDEGVSARYGRNRRGGQLADLVAAVKSKVIPPGSVVLVESTDWLSRQDPITAVVALRDLCDEGVSVVTLADGTEYTAQSLRDSSALQSFGALISAARSNQESVIKGMRVRAAWDHKRTKAAEGRAPMTMMLPAWLTSAGKGKPAKLIPESAKVVLRVFKMYARGIGIIAIQRALNSEGVPTLIPAKARGPKGRGRAVRWHESYLSRLLRNPAAMGTYQPMTTSHDDDGKRERKPMGPPIAKFYPAAVPAALFEQVQAMLADTNAPARGKAQGDLKNLFGSLAECSNCGASMRRKVMTRKLRDGTRAEYHYLACTASMAGAGHAYKAVPYGPVEACFLEQAPALFAVAPAADEALAAQLRRADANLEALEEHRGQLLALRLETSMPSLNADLLQVDAEVDAKRAERDALAGKADAAAGPLLDSRLRDLRAALAVDAAELDRAHVNALLRSVLSAVKVDADEKVAELMWKHGGTSEVIFGFPAEPPAKLSAKAKAAALRRRVPAKARRARN